MPVVVAAVAVFVERRVPSRMEGAALLLLTSGVIIAVFEGKAGGNSFGVCLSITGAGVCARWEGCSSCMQGTRLSVTGSSC